jgi:hypothetical protein
MPAEQITLDRATHKYSVDLPSVTQVLQDCGIIDTTWFTDEARDRGSRVHLYCEQYDLGILDWSEVQDGDEDYVRCYIVYKKAHPELAWDWIEIPMMDKAGLYCGTTDRMIHIRPKAIWDLKTGLEEDWHAIQLAAYANMDGDPWSYERNCLYLNKEGRPAKRRTYPKESLKEDLDDWWSAYRIYRRKRKGK